MSALRLQYLSVLATVALVSSGCAYNGGVTGQLANIRDAFRPIGATMNTKLYVVQVGDNLSYIAWRYQTTVQNLIVWNNLSDPNVLQAGQPLVVRGQPVSSVSVAQRAPAAIQPVARTQVSAYQAQGSLEAVPVPSRAPQAQMSQTQSVVIPPSDEQTIVVMPSAVAQAETPRPEARVEEKVVVSNVSYKKPETGKWVWPVDGRIMKPFGGPDSNQKGIDISSVPGQPIRATTGGIVAFAGVGVPVLGNTVIVDHADDMVSAYTRVGELLVAEGEEIMAGDVIAYAAGVSGQEKSRVHFEIRKQGRPLDPLSRLAKR